MCPLTDDMIFVVDYDASAIWYGSLETAQLELDKIDTTGWPYGVNYNPSDNTVYWTELDGAYTGYGYIKRMVIGSSNTETVIPSATVPGPITC